MDDVGLDLAQPGDEARHRQDVGESGIAVDRRRSDAERQAAGNARQRRFDPRATAAAIEEHADFVAARALFGGEIDHMAKQAAERRAKDVDDPKLSVCALDAAIVETHCGRWLFDNAIS